MTHEERLALIYRPFRNPHTTVPHALFGNHALTTSYPWGGCAVVDTFYGTHDWAERPRPSSDNAHYSYGPVGLRAGEMESMGVED